MSYNKGAGPWQMANRDGHWNGPGHLQIPKLLAEDAQLDILGSEWVEKSGGWLGELLSSAYVISTHNLG
jgi:hypothetical protein